MPARLTVAFHTVKNKFVHIDNTESGDSNCQCFDCKGALIPRKGDIRTAHFSHKSNTVCPGITPLHKLAEQIIIDNTEMKVSETESWYYSDAKAGNLFKAESVFVTTGQPIDKRTPDVIAKADNEEIFFEVAVTNPKSEDTKSFYRSNKKRCVEINLKDTPLDSSYERVKNDVLIEWRNKEIIYPIPEKKSEPIKKNNNDEFWFFAKLLAGLAAISYVLYKLYRFFKKT